MRRIEARHILILVAILHLLSDAALAGRLVVCVGPDGHRALEVEHLGAAGCESATPETSGGASITASRGDCADSPLHPEADIAAGNQDRAWVSFFLAALPRSFVSAPILDRPALYARVRALDIAPGLHAQRTTVLLL